MSEGNGSYVSRAELTAHLEPMREDIREIKQDVKAIADSQWLGPQGRTFLSGGALLAASVAIAIAVFFH